MKSWFDIKAKADAGADSHDAEILIYDEIGGWGIRAKDFIGSLQSSGIKRPLVRINSPGGDVFDGLAIHNYLRGLNATIQIDGVAASIASIIAMAGKEVRISDNGYLMIHNPWGVAIGDAENMRDQADLLDKLQNTLAQTYAKKTGKDQEEVKKWMSSETWFSADEAKSAGLVDTITEAVSFAASTQTFKSAPEALRNALGSSQADHGKPRVNSGSNQSQPNKPMNELTKALALAGLITSAELDEAQAVSEFSAKLKALTDERDNLKNQVDSMSAVVGEIESLKAQIQAAQDEKDAAAVDAAVADGRISEESKTDWVAKIKTDRSSLDLLAKLPSGRPQVGTTPLNQTASKSADELRAEFDAITDPKAKTNFWRQHKASLLKK